MAALKFEHTYYWFSRNFAIPSIAHGLASESVFKAILQNRKLLRSSDRPDTENPNMSFVDRLLKLDNGIWFAPGFAYNVDASHYPFGLILSLDELDSSFDIFKLEINHFFYREIVRYWHEEEPAVFAELCKDSQMKEQLETFVRTDDTEPRQKGYKAGILFPWSLASRYEEGYRLTQNKAALERRLDRKRRELTVRFFKRRYVMREFWAADYRTKSEIIAHRTIELDSPRLIGFFIADAFNKPRPAVKEAIIDFMQNSRHLQKEKLLVFDGRQKKLLQEWLRSDLQSAPQRALLLTRP